MFCQTYLKLFYEDLKGNLKASTILGIVKVANSEMEKFQWPEGARLISVSRPPDTTSILACRPVDITEISESARLSFVNRPPDTSWHLVIFDSCYRSATWTGSSIV